MPLCQRYASLRLGIVTALLICSLLLYTLGCAQMQPANAHKDVQAPARAGRDKPKSPQSQYVEMAFAYLENHAARLGLRQPREELAVIGEDVDRLQHRRIRLQQVKNNVPVWSHQLFVHIGADETVRRVDGRIFQGLAGVRTEPVLSEQEAQHAARAAMPGGAEAWRAQDAQLYIYPMQPDRAALAYLVTVMRGLERQLVFIDARDGTRLAQLEGSPSR